MPTPQQVTSTTTDLVVWEVDNTGNVRQDGGIEFKADASPEATPSGHVQLYSPDGAALWTQDSSGTRSVLSAGAGTTGGLDWINVRAYGAVGDNVTDDTTALQNAINACPNNGVVYVPVGRYRITAPLILPPGVALRGESQPLRPRNSFNGNANLANVSYISPRSTFVGAAAIYVPDANLGGWSTMAQGSGIYDLVINCSALASGSADGVKVHGQVQGFVAENVSTIGTPGYGFNFAVNAAVASGPKNPFSLRLTRCFATGGGTATTTGGFFIYNATDSTFTDCETIAVGGDGWTIQGGGNTHFIGCRSENNSPGNGFVTAQTSGGTNASANMVSCSTNGNSLNGFSLAAAQTVTLADCVASGEGATSAGFSITSTTGIVALSGCTSPLGATSQYGVRVTGALNTVISGGLYFGTSAGVSDGGGNTTLIKSPNVVELAGSSTTPTVTVAGVRTGTNALSNQGGFSLGSWQATNNSFVAVTADPMITGNSSAALTRGTVYLASVYIPVATSLTTCYYYIITGGSGGATAGQNFVGLYNAAGTRLATTNVDAQADTVTGLQTVTWASTAVTPGMYWVAFVYNTGTAAPALARASTQLLTFMQAGQSAAQLRFAVNGTGATSLASSITPSSNVAGSGLPLLAAVA